MNCIHCHEPLAFHEQAPALPVHARNGRQPSDPAHAVVRDGYEAGELFLFRRAGPSELIACYASPPAPAPATAPRPLQTDAGPEGLRELAASICRRYGRDPESPPEVVAERWREGEYLPIPWEQRLRMSDAEILQAADEHLTNRIGPIVGRLLDCFHPGELPMVAARLSPAPAGPVVVETLDFMQERQRCLEWVERMLRVLPGDSENRPLYHVRAGIESGTWPPGRES